MLGGFNTNIRYKGRIFHVQTEDSGAANPKIVTLLYEGGVILTSHKSSYQDQIEVDDLESIVRERMEAQHRAMLRELKEGALDELAGLAEAPPTAGGSRRSAAFGVGVVTDTPLDELILSSRCSG